MKKPLIALAAAVAVWTLPARAQLFTFLHFVGSPGGASYEDGSGSSVHFHTPVGVAVDSSGNVYVADSVNHVIRRVSPNGVATTFAGRAGQIGAADGVGGAALFNEPLGVAVDSHDVVFVADTKNHTIRKITPDRVVSTFAGLATISGGADGNGTAARFQNPAQLAFAPGGDLIVADSLNHTIRRITPSGDVTTVAGTANSAGNTDGNGAAARFQRPNGVAVAADGTIFVSDTYNHTIRRIATNGDVTTYAGKAQNPGEDEGPVAFARFTYPGHLAIDSTGGLLVADSGNHAIRRIASDIVTTYVGNPGNPGTSDGTGPTARFLNPIGLASAPNGLAYVADTGNHTLRKVASGGVVTTLAGTGLLIGNADGTGSAALFSAPTGLAVDGQNNVYVADAGNDRIRKISTSGAVTTAASGDLHAPQGVAFGGGTLYVADTGSHTIRQVSGGGVITVVAGVSNSPGNTEGTGSNARFRSPRGLAVDAATGTIYVADTGNHSIRKIAPGGVVSTLAGQSGTAGSANGTGSAARFSSPSAIVFDGASTLYVADTGNSTIRKVTTDGVVTTIAGFAGRRGSEDGTGQVARFSGPLGLTIDASKDKIYVADTGNDTIRSVDVSSAQVTTVAGVAGAVEAVVDGSSSDARFTEPTGIVIDGNGRITLSEPPVHALRVGVTRLRDKAILDTVSGSIGQQRQLTTSPLTANSWNWTILRRPSGSTAELSSPFASSPTFTPDIADVYVFRVIGKTSSAAAVSTVTLTICAAATPVITRTAGAEPSCPGASVTLDAGAGYLSYQWSTGETTRTITISPTTQTTYTVTAVDGAGCSAPAATYTHGVSGVLESVTIAPLLAGSAGSGAGACGTNVGSTFLATEVGGGAVAHQWGYRTTSGGSITPLAGRTGDTYTLILADFPAPGPYLLVTTATPACGSARVSNEIAVNVQAGATSRLVPIVLDVSTGSAHFTSSLALTNRGAQTAAVTLKYTASLGANPQGSGTVPETLPPGRQLVIPSVLEYLRGKGLPLPPSSSAPQQGGSLLVTFDGIADVSAVAATARTTADTAAPQPVGSAGLAYSGIGTCETLFDVAYVYGLRSNDADRANLALFNASATSVTLKVTITGDGKALVVRDALPLPPYGWVQLTRVLDGTGIGSGYATVERISGAGAFGAYAVVNDNATNDGSYLGALPAGFTGNALTLPVLVEIKEPRFLSELVLANRGSAPANLAISYLESIAPQLGAGGTVSITIGPGEQRIIPNAIDYLRKNGASLGAAGASSYAGAARVSVSGVSIGEIFVGARALAPSPAGGQFGLFVPPVYPGEEASAEAYVYGLSADSTHRSNVAVYNAGASGDGAITLQLTVFDGDAAGQPKGSPVTVTLEPGQWTQAGGILKNAGVANGWVRIQRLSGLAPWSGYGVVNDGGNPGERTGDGAFVPLVR